MLSQISVSEQSLGKQMNILPEGSVTSPQGFVAGGLHCGIKRKKLDLGWIISETPAVAAGVYTRNRFQAAPLQITQQSIAVEGKLQAVLVNSGNANACTGRPGLENALRMRDLLASQLNVPVHHCAITSTGVIGQQLPMDKIERGIGQISKDPGLNQTDWFEQAILTTDTCVKHVAVEIDVDGRKVTIGGTAKGSGMIHPNMATMLAFITTDARVEQPVLQEALGNSVDRTFNMITVDGDTSTNDMVLLMANGAAGVGIGPTHPAWPTFCQALEFVCRQLAKKIARDGEGATKLIEVQVLGAVSYQAAVRIGKAVLSSNLVKTAIFGHDPNWGRIVCAVGYSGEDFDPEKVSIALGPITVVHQGLPIPFNEAEAEEYLKQEEIIITIDMHSGTAMATAWGCDLSYEYVRINAAYRT